MPYSGCLRAGVSRRWACLFFAATRCARLGRQQRFSDQVDRYPRSQPNKLLLSLTVCAAAASDCESRAAVASCWDPDEGMGSAAPAVAVSSSMLDSQEAASSPSPLSTRSTFTAEPAADGGPSGPGPVADMPCSGPEDLQWIPPFAAELDWTAGVCMSAATEVCVPAAADTAATGDSAGKGTASCTMPARAAASEGDPAAEAYRLAEWLVLRDAFGVKKAKELCRVAGDTASSMLSAVLLLGLQLCCPDSCSSEAAAGELSTTSLLVLLLLAAAAARGLLELLPSPQAQSTGTAGQLHAATCGGRQVPSLS
jgi:hypothetical protein